jgi:hypothetical protein
MRSGFSRLLSAADDLVLDIPEAVHLLSLFLGRYAFVLVGEGRAEGGMGCVS